jgi:hypothetical protein
MSEAFVALAENPYQKILLAIQKLHLYPRVSPRLDGPHGLISLYR